MIVCGEIVGLAALAAQNMGRAGPIPPNPEGTTWSSPMAVAILLAAVSGVVAFLGARQGRRRLALGWVASCALFLLAAAYLVWGLAG